MRAINRLYKNGSNFENRTKFYWRTCDPHHTVSHYNSLRRRPRFRLPARRFLDSLSLTTHDMLHDSEPGRTAPVL